MKWQTGVLPMMIRVMGSILLLGLVAMQSARSQYTCHEIRIGLQTRQAEVRLSSTVPVCLETAGQQPLTIPAEQEMIFRPKGDSVAVFNTAGQEQAITGTRVQVVPTTAATQPPVAPAPNSTTPLPLIRLLGPTRHYDQRADRPYRGQMEILATAGGLTVVNVLDIESYLLGVVSSEMKPSYPLEALKAQAVAARTYALKNLGHNAALGFDLDDTQACQVYGGYFSEDPRTTRAVNETAGMVLTYHGDLIDAVYSSTCAGYTESAAEAWGRNVPYLISVADFDPELNPTVTHPQNEEEWASYFKTIRPFHCLQPKYARVEAFRWVKMITRKDLEAGLPEEYQVGTVQQIVPLHRGCSGRITALRLVGSQRSVVIEKESAIRRAFGGLRSSGFTVDTFRDDNGVPVVFALWGGGWGHGLGMCQVGALGLADQGCPYEKILAYYYHGVTIERR